MKKFFLKVLQSILKFLASLVLKSKKPRIIAITGSVAKSSTKEAIWWVLKEKLDVRKNEGNLNTEIGVPLAILGFKKSPRWFISWPFFILWAICKATYYTLPFTHYPKWLILEMAADKPDDIAYLVSFARPNIGVITAVGPSHLQAFKTIENVAEEKMKLAKALPKDGFAILNGQDPLIVKRAKQIKAKVLFFTSEDIPSAATTIIGKIFKLSNEEIERRLKNYTPLKGRMNILYGIRGTVILDDSYNANPLSMEYALKRLKSQSLNVKTARRIAVLGDMLELGDYAEEGHREVGKIAKENCDLLLTTGNNARYIAEEGRGQHFETKKELIDFLKSEIKNGDIILIKASRGMKFEEIVRAVRR
jgi:UDP-N-acetylmuramoyl-tripeptide--D-alanyl-D-alanine ligase